MRPLFRRDAIVARVAPLVAIVCLAGQARAENREMNSSLAGQLRLFQLRVASGRISAVGPASQQNLASNYMGPQRRERLSIDLADGQPTVAYERTAPEEKISIEIIRGHKVLIQQVPRSTGDRASVSFVQPREGALSLTVTIGDRSTAYTAPTLWHLLLAEPDAAREYLVPLLEIVRPNWPLVEQAQELERVLCRDEVRASVLDVAAWKNYIDALASPRYVDRERAHERLRAEGATILPFLRSAERAGLDAEQSLRVKRIIRALSGGGDEDSPERVASSLAGDPRVWYALLDRENVGVRRKAAGRLERLLAVTIDFDPTAPAAERDRQAEALRERFADQLAPPKAPKADAE